MNVLIAGEFSGIVRDAFTRCGHDAVSCDYRPSEQPGPHYQGSWFDQEILKQPWDLMIAHPDCTFLVVSGARWMSVEWREEAQLAALHTVKALMKLPISRIAIENPVGKLSSLWRGPDQIIQPYQFGDPFKKTTCLWLKNLPLLVPTNDLGNGAQACWKEPPSPERKKNRARTYPGIAEAMADQWGWLKAGAVGDSEVGSGARVARSDHRDARLASAREAGSRADGGHTVPDLPALVRYTTQRDRENVRASELSAHVSGAATRTRRFLMSDA